MHHDYRFCLTGTDRGHVFRAVAFYCALCGGTGSDAGAYHTCPEAGHIHLYSIFGFFAFDFSPWSALGVCTDPDRAKTIAGMAHSQSLLD